MFGAFTFSNLHGEVVEIDGVGDCQDDGVYTRLITTSECFSADFLGVLVFAVDVISNFYLVAICT